jgi:hypothetical protein
MHPFDSSRRDRRKQSKMKFDPSTISAAKREEWAEVERQCAIDTPPVRAPATFNGERLLWFVGAELHCDGYVFAQCYEMPIDSSQELIVNAVRRLYGDVKIVFDESLL